MKKIPFTITIKKQSYSGYLQSNDITVPPKVFFVFIDNYIVGNLLCRDKWTFEQVGEKFNRMTENERTEIGEYLGNIAVEGYESLF
jgi:hypothetical protein